MAIIMTITMKRTAPTMRPRIAILATGGTIAGKAKDATRTSNYRAAVVDADALVRSVSALSDVARIQTEQVASIVSNDMTPALWITLTRRINMLLHNDDVNGIVITHGTDTLEETAYLLHLTVKSEKPVVLTGAMRPSTSLSADGPLNLLNAVTVAANASALRQGVLVVFNNQIHSARDAVKISTYSADAFRSPGSGALGWVQDGRVKFQRAIAQRHTLHSRFSIGNSLPAVEVVKSYAGASRAAVEAFISAGARGLVIAGTGNGSLHSAIKQAVTDATRHGVVAVRASRVGEGQVLRNGAALDDVLGTIAAGTFSPFKSRVLLMLMLAAGVRDRAEQQQIFDTY